MGNIRYRIPDRHLEGFKFLVSLSPTEIDALLHEITSIKLGSLPHVISEDISKRIGVEAEKLDQIFSSLNGLLVVKEEATDTVDQFSGSIADAYGEQADDKNFDKRRLSDFLTQFFIRGKNYRISLKASYLGFENEKLARRFRIITDIRPVFDDNDGKVIEGSVIVHSLNIDYMEHSKLKKAVFTLDETDIDDLKKILQRATEKEATLKESLKNTSLKTIELK